jgi:hypothetical protein
MTTTDPVAALPAVDVLPVSPLCEIRVAFDPAMLVYETPGGLRIDAIVSGGTVRGPRLDAEVLAGGGDWLTVPPDGIARMDVRATFRTPDGAVLHYTSTGRISLGDDARQRFLAGETVHGDEVHGRAAPLFETAAEPYRWLNGVLAVGRVVALSLRHIRYQLFVVD